MSLTDAQRLRDFCADHAIAKRALLPREEFIDGQVTEGGLAYIYTRTYVTIEQGAATRITASHLVVYCYVWTGRCYRFAPTRTMRVADDTFEPINIGRYSARPVSEYVARREHARMAYRVGTARYPLDSYARTLEGSGLSQSHYR